MSTQRVATGAAAQAFSVEPGAAHGSAVAIVGGSAACLHLVAQIRKFASNDAAVLIEGETGSGKELVARAMHYLSCRRDKPFVPVNCGAIPDSLIEAELFGHVRGSFTDAKSSRAGVIAHAEGGTLFLDEVDALSPKGQVTLLRFLQDRRYRPVGHATEHIADVRVMAACNKSLQHLAAGGGFRSDLLYRLNILTVRVPPLRERADDVECLADHYLRLFCARYQRSLKRLDDSTLQWFKQYEWPGNVRELENLIHRLVLLSDGDRVHYSGESARDDASDGRQRQAFQTAKTKAIEAFERAYLSRLMADTGGNVSAAARLASKERRALGKLLKKHGIDKDAYRGRR
jgi:DNA-binding NtrC family response regulator